MALSACVPQTLFQTVTVTSPATPLSQAPNLSLISSILQATSIPGVNPSVVNSIISNGLASAQPLPSQSGVVQASALPSLIGSIIQSLPASNLNQPDIVSAINSHLSTAQVPPVSVPLIGQTPPAPGQPTVTNLIPSQSGVIQASVLPSLIGSIIQSLPASNLNQPGIISAINSHLSTAIPSVSVPLIGQTPPIPSQPAATGLVSSQSGIIQASVLPSLIGSIIQSLPASNLNQPGIISAINSHLSTAIPSVSVPLIGQTPPLPGQPAATNLVPSQPLPIGQLTSQALGNIPQPSAIVGNPISNLPISNPLSAPAQQTPGIPNPIAQPSLSAQLSVAPQISISVQPLPGVPQNSAGLLPLPSQLTNVISTPQVITAPNVGLPGLTSLLQPNPTQQINSLPGVPQVSNVVPSSNPTSAINPLPGLPQLSNVLPSPNPTQQINTLPIPQASIPAATSLLESVIHVSNIPQIISSVLGTATLTNLDPGAIGNLISSHLATGSLPAITPPASVNQLVPTITNNLAGPLSSAGLNPSQISQAGQAISSILSSATQHASAVGPISQIVSNIVATATSINAGAIGNSVSQALANTPISGINPGSVGAAVSSQLQSLPVGLSGPQLTASISQLLDPITASNVNPTRLPSLVNSALAPLTSNNPSIAPVSSIINLLPSISLGAGLGLPSNGNIIPSLSVGASVGGGILPSASVTAGLGSQGLVQTTPIINGLPQPSAILPAISTPNALVPTLSNILTPTTLLTRTSPLASIGINPTSGIGISIANPASNVLPLPLPSTANIGLPTPSLNIPLPSLNIPGIGVSASVPNAAASLTIGSVVVSSVVNGITSQVTAPLVSGPSGLSLALPTPNSPASLAGVPVPSLQPAASVIIQTEIAPGVSTRITAPLISASIGLPNGLLPTLSLGGILPSPSALIPTLSVPSVPSANIASIPQVQATPPSVSINPIASITSNAPIQIQTSFMVMTTFVTSTVAACPNPAASTPRAGGGLLGLNVTLK